MFQSWRQAPAATIAMPSWGATLLRQLQHRHAQVCQGRQPRHVGELQGPLAVKVRQLRQRGQFAHEGVVVALQPSAPPREVRMCRVPKQLDVAELQYRMQREAGQRRQAGQRQVLTQVLQQHLVGLEQLRLRAPLQLDGQRPERFHLLNAIIQLDQAIGVRHAAVSYDQVCELRAPTLSRARSVS